ncbi:nucleoside triphosphate pyrophosphohydrolase [Microbacterium sp. MEC084]|jgi:XTP/dITP diphosphohydrolase|uniref:MazG family protein n=1 Tax=unclassified Microbacterium TaxID=2609290 RepID=UPI0006F38C37|nr:MULTISPECIES: MazG family protein [unclassified Microbacterium]KQZ05040.1 nucleoside triphosphate hydrolase [Microbacterium sp. Root53]MCD1267685.1 nucleoside triphosphate pyrophosphohydrolase [Microbacterium sp. MEC084]
MTADALRQAVETMRTVRDRCVWTQGIDHRALVPYLIEESHELIDAIEAGGRGDLREELGDLLWQVLFHAEIASRDAAEPFDIDDVAATLVEKMVRRHPHVFAGETAETPERVLELWNAAKAAEKRQRLSVLDGVARSMPSLALAQKLVGKAAQVGAGDEIAVAVHDAAEVGAVPESEEELGDLLLTLAAAARANGWDAERALRERLRALEAEIRERES